MSTKEKNTSVDKIYRLTMDAAPLSYMLPTRNTRRYPLLWFDEEKNINKPLRYAVNQPSPFEDEQDGNAIVEPIIFENGFLTVPRTNPVLQQFLYYHPLNGKMFAELNEEKDAQAELEELDLEVEAWNKAKNMPIEQLEMAARVIFGIDTSKMTSSTLKRDVIIYARRNPRIFLDLMEDPELTLQSQVQQFFDSRLLSFRNNNKEVWINTAAQKRRMLIVPYGEDPIITCITYFKTDDGIEILKMLESLVED